MRVLAVAGASGGHIFPATSFLESLKKRNQDSQALLVLPERSSKIQIKKSDFEVRYISILPVSLSFKRNNIIALWNFFRGTLQSIKLLFYFKPDVVVGFGGIESIPLVFFAWIFRLKTLIHEQNVSPGLANRLLSKFVDKVAISFTETRKYLKIHQERVLLTGNPVIQRLKTIAKKEALEFFGLKENKFTVLVTGGSQGSHSINSAFLWALLSMNDNYKFQVIHITGEADFDNFKRRYRDLSKIVDSRVFAFLKEMQYAYSISDLAVTRGGATTISELLSFELPAVVIPYPYARKHQWENALVLEKLGTAVVIQDDDSLNSKLKDILQELVNSPEKIKSMRNNFNNYDVRNSASDLLVDALLQ